MRSFTLKARARNMRRELVGLLLASLGCVVLLMRSVIVSGDAGGASLGIERLILVLLVIAGATAASFMVWLVVGNARQEVRRVETENNELRRNLATTQSIIQAEHQVLVFWEQGQPVRVLTHSLGSVPGLPQAQDVLLRFGQWLEPRSATMLKSGLDALFAEGNPFNIILRTTAGGRVEAAGRAAAGRAVLRLTGIAGYKHDLAYIAEQHLLMAHDIRAGRVLLDALPMPAWLRDASGRLTWINSAYVAAVEATGQQEVIERQIELLEPRQRQSAARALAKADNYRERIHLVVSGARRAFDVMIMRVENKTAGAAIDVTALESAQGELARQIAAYDRTLDRVSMAIAAFDPGQKLAFFNEAFVRLWRLDPEWLDQRPGDGDILDRLHDLDRLPEVANYRDWKARRLDAYRNAPEPEDWWHLPDGRIIHVECVQRADGGVTYLYADETERLSLESRYNALIGVQRETLDSLKEGVAVFGTDGRLKLFNTAFAAIWKLSRRTLEDAPHVEEIISLTRVLYEEPGTWARIRNAVTAFTDERAMLEGQMIRPDNSVIDYAATPLPDGGTLLTFVDVTASKRYERALEERNEALIASDRMKSQFIGHVSYELRTPLTTIIGFSDLLTSPYFGSLNPKQLEYVTDINTSSRTLLAIIDDILDLTTIDAGAMELKLAPVDVRAVIEGAIKGVQERAMRDGLTLDIGIADDVTTFNADETRVRQVLYNLLSNAVGFSKPGDTVHLTCWRQGGYIIFTVEDQGVGIPKDQLARVFERFESLSQGSKHRGAGLGLPIARKLVELHGGDMSLDSEPGTGTRVTVRLPERGRSTAPRPTAVAKGFG